MTHSKNKLSAKTIILHWLVALTVISLIAVGIYMSENKVWSLYPIHKSIGTIIFVFILLRVINRIKEGWPKPVSVYKNWEIALSKIIHWVLLLGTLMFPISGLMMSAAGGHGIAVFGLELLASNYNAAGEAIALNESLAGLGHTVHEYLPWILIPAIVLHIAGAWKHHLIDKDNTLKRMIGRS